MRFRSTRQSGLGRGRAGTLEVVEREIDTQQEQERHEPLPVWDNTRPRGNPDLDRHDLERSQERLEAVVGR
jgi:hypothetical protein